MFKHVQPIVVIVLLLVANLSNANERGENVLAATGIKGGLIVHVGCGNGELSVALAGSDGCLVHALDTDPKNIAACRALVREKGLAKKVSVALFDGKHLPYVDESVNLVVAENAGELLKAEIDRVLAPLGVSYVGKVKTSKPWPKEIDEWTHYMHDASGNAVAHDQRVGPPRHLQWQAGPRWSRHHDHMASMSAMVSARGRMFYIFDEGSHVSPQLPSDWKLIARDAFNGVVLWKRKIDLWHPALWPLKSGPANLPRRLVSVDQTVYTTLGITDSVVALDAASGKTLRQYEKTSGAEEILFTKGMLLVLVNRTAMDFAVDLEEDDEGGRSRDSRTTPSPEMRRIWAGIRSKRWSNGNRVIRAFDAATGRVLWEKESLVIPLTLAADGDGVYYHNGEAVVSLATDSGKEQWISPPLPVWKGIGGRGTQSWFAPTLVVRDGKVLFAGGEKTHMSYMGWGSKDIGEDSMAALSTKTGKKLWTAEHPFSGYNSPEDLFVIDGKVWVGKTAKGGPGTYLGHDIATGDKAKDYPPTVDTHWFHHRCYRAKATDRYILCSRAGIEYVDVRTGEWTPNHWVRGGCLYGIMPANGLTYTPTHPCACYPEAKLYGFTALAAATKSRAVPKDVDVKGRLEKGPSYGAIKKQNAASTWPTYRHDGGRSGATTEKVSARVQQKWTAKLGGRLTQPVIGGGRLFVSDIDSRTIFAIEAASGKILWKYHAGGRVDSPPTFVGGRLLFGSADGYVTCLSANDGLLAWRFRAAPVDRRIVAFEQLESLWPVHGSVLVQDGVVTFAAGRSMYLDGGLRICRLNVVTGELLSEKIHDDRDPESGENMQRYVRGLNMPVALPDILSCDGERLFMRSQAMDLEGKRLKFGPGGSGHAHLFAPYGFTDDSWFHRNYWLVNDAFSGGVGGFQNGKKNPSGRILVDSGETIFGYGRKPSYYRWSSVIDYQLFAASKSSVTVTKPDSKVAAAVPAIYFPKSASLNPTGKELTIAAWVKSDAKNGTILVRGANSAGFGLILTDGKLRMLLRNKGKTHDTVASKAFGTDWTHVAGVLHKDGTMRVYVNGELGGITENVPLLPVDPMIVMKVGADDEHQLLPKPLSPFSGAMDEVMLFYRALSVDQIKRLATGGKDLADADRQNMVLYLDFESGKAKDRSPSKNHGKVALAKPQTLDGPHGEALVFKPAPAPKSLASSRRRGKASGSVGFHWTQDSPVTVRAMVLADQTLFVAGPRDMLDEVAAFQEHGEPASKKQIADYSAALVGKRGGILQGIDAKTGETIAEYALDSPPVFDGLIAADGKLFITTMDGQLIAFGE